MTQTRDWIVRILLAAILVAVGFVYYSLSERLDNATARVMQVDAAVKSREITRHLISETPKNSVRDLLCADVNAPVCNLAKPQSYQNLGDHAPSWVFFDALVQIGYADLNQDLRSQFNRIVSDLGAALNSAGALDYIQARDSSEWFAATSLHRALLTQAAVCLKVESVRCRNGFPVTLTEALRRASDFIEKNGKAVSVYEMSFRWGAIGLVSKLVSRSGNPAGS